MLNSWLFRKVCGGNQESSRLLLRLLGSSVGVLVEALWSISVHLPGSRYWARPVASGAVS